jgi:hypothetical protein
MIRLHVQARITESDQLMSINHRIRPSHMFWFLKNLIPDRVFLEDTFSARPWPYQLPNFMVPGSLALINDTTYRVLISTKL